MTKYQDEQVIRDIQSKIDIIDLVSETVELKRKGNRYWGLCPFHQEKTASFSVSQDKQIFYCFGCHAGGDIFSFVMKREGLNFKEALALLAAKAGVQLASFTHRKVIDKQKKVAEVNRATAEFYQKMLLGNQGQAARSYLQNRGITGESIKEFKLGYAPDNWNALGDYLLKKDFFPDYVKLSGVIKRSENQSSYYDVFRNRIIFPILNYSGEVVGFGGRALGDTQPKYLNSPETEVFSKRHNLYGIYQARDSIRAENEAILVEGYIDCIKLNQAGIKNVVASLGTAFTEEQARLLQRYTEKVLILYDGDEAGQRETLRAIDVLNARGFKVNAVTLPAGKDPDEYLQIFGKEEFWEYVKNNRCNYIEFKINRYINSVPELNLDTKTMIIKSLQEDIRRLDSELEKDYCIRTLAQKLEVEENIIYRQITASAVKQGGTNYRNKILINRDNTKYGNYGVQEKLLIAMLNSEDIFYKVKHSIGLGFFKNSEYKALIKLYDQLEGNCREKTDMLSGMVLEKGLQSSWAKILLLMEEAQVNDIEIEGYIRKISLLQIEGRWQKLLNNIQDLNTDGDFNTLLQFILKIDTFLDNTREGGIR